MGDAIAGRGDVEVDLFVSARRAAADAADFDEKPDRTWLVHSVVAHLDDVVGSVSPSPQDAELRAGWPFRVSYWRDAADVAISTGFGFAQLVRFNVVTEEVTEGETSKPSFEMAAA